MELRRYATILWRWSWLFVVGTTLAAAAALLVSRSQPPLYAAKGTILVNQAQAVTGPTYTDVLANQQLSKTYSQLVTSGPVLERVGENLGFTYKQLRKMVSAGVRRDTQLIDITVKHRDPETAARVANEVARVFADQIRQAQLGQQTTAESDLEAQIAALQASINERQRDIQRLSAPVPGLSDAERQQQLSTAQAQLTSLRENQATVERRLQELRIDLARSINSVSLANPARVPEQPVSPRTPLNVALGALLGLLVVGGFVALREYLDDTVKSAEDVARAGGAVLLGAIGRVGPRRWWQRRRARCDPPRLIGSREARSPVGEAYRLVRANLEFARNGRESRTLLITSALAGEGKSTTAANLALVLAQTGQRVVLVDADMRRPMLDRTFNVPNTAGLSTLFVMDDPNVVGLLRPTPFDNVQLLPSGPLPPNPAELLASPRMLHIIEHLTAVADIVVFDTPPLLGVADAASLAARVDGVVLVVDSGRTRLGALAHAIATLKHAHATLWGVVLNKLKSRTLEGYYYDYAARTIAADQQGQVQPAQSDVLIATKSRR